jgi:hypothetical protein
MKKGGEPKNHSLACRLVKAWYRSKVSGCIVEKDWPVYFSRDFIIKEKLRYPYHEYDLAFFEYITGEGKDQSYAKIHTVVEIDGERHVSKLVKINDGVASKYIKETWPHAKFVRLNKLDVLHEDGIERNKYLRKMFGISSSSMSP